MVVQVLLQETLEVVVQEVEDLQVILEVQVVMEQLILVVEEVLQLVLVEHQEVVVLE